MEFLYDYGVHEGNEWSSVNVPFFCDFFFFLVPPKVLSLEIKIILFEILSDT